MRPWWFCSWAFLAAFVACGGDAPSDATAVARTALEPAACAGTWKTIHAPKQVHLSQPGELAWHAGRIYFSTRFSEESAIVTEDGRPEGFTRGASYARHLVATSDGLHSINAVLGPEDFRHEFELRRLAPNGVDLVPVTKFRFAAPPMSFLAGPFALGPDAIFGGISMGSEYRISRFHPETGSEQVLGSLTHEEGRAPLIERIVLWREWLAFLASDGAYFVPVAGGAPVRVSWYAGNPRGPVASPTTGQMLWSGYAAEGAKTAAFLAVSQIGSAEPPRRIHPQGLPKELGVSTAWDDGAGGWLLLGFERLADGAFHASIWILDASLTTAQRLACDPEVGRYVEFGYLAPAGLYFAVSALDLDYYTELAFVARP